MTRLVRRENFFHKIIDSFSYFTASILYEGELQGTIL